MNEETKKDNPTEEQEQPKETEQETDTETPTDTAPTLEQLQSENARLRAEVLRGRLDAEVMSQAPTLGADPKSVPYLMKLADFSHAVTDKGEVDKDAVGKALKKVLEDLPALKMAPEQSGGFHPIGGNGGRDRSDKTAENKVRAWFGLAPQK